MDSSNKSLYGLVIVTYNRSAILRQCLQALVESNNWLFVKQLYIVDNNSSDATEIVAESFVSEYPTRITYLKMTKNLGGAGGFERGCRQAYDDGLEWIGLLDDDVILDSNCLSTLYLHRHEKCLIAVREDLSGALAEFGALRFNFSNPLKLNPKVSSIATCYQSREKMPERLAVDSGSFEGFFVHRSVIDKIGFPHGDYFIFGDDTDYSIRVRRAGYQILAIRDARIIRQLPFNRYQDTSWKAYYRWRNFFVLHFLYGENILVRCKPYLMVWGLALLSLVKHLEVQSFTVLRDSMKLASQLKEKQKNNK